MIDHPLYSDQPEVCSIHNVEMDGERCLECEPRERATMTAIERDDLGRPVCRPARPWTAEDGTPVVHPDAREVGEQEAGRGCGDIVTYQCPHCAARWRSELPQ